MNILFRKKKKVIMSIDVTERRNTNLKVLMFPWLAYGHISPFLNLAKKLADKGFLICVCSTPISLESINKEIPEKYSTSIKIVEFHIPNLPELLAPRCHTTNDLPPNLDHIVQKALKLSKPNFSKILENLKPDLVIYDILLQWAEGVANEHNIPSIKFITCGAAIFSYLFNSLRKPEVEFPFPNIYPKESELVKWGEISATFAKEKDPDDVDPFTKGSMQVMLMSTSRIIEAKYIDYLSELSNWKVIPVGLPIKDPMINDTDDVELINWLQKKNENSTVFVNFGSEYLLTKEDMEEIAFGLEFSNVNFIWVVRFPKEEAQNLEEALPQGFLERIGERGKVLQKWGPKARILNHISIGGFINYCDWNSIIKCLDFGVPIIAMPIYVDQPMNARLMVELEVAVQIIRDNDSKIYREEIAQVLESVIFGKIGENLRTKVRDISKKLKSMRGEEMDAAVEELIQLCNNKKCK